MFKNIENLKELTWEFVDFLSSNPEAEECYPKGLDDFTPWMNDHSLYAVELWEKYEEDQEEYTKLHYVDYCTKCQAFIHERGTDLPEHDENTVVANPNEIGAGELLVHTTKNPDYPHWCLERRIYLVDRIVLLNGKLEIYLDRIADFNTIGN